MRIYASRSKIEGFQIHHVGTDFNFLTGVQNNIDRIEHVATIEIGDVREVDTLIEILKHFKEEHDFYLENNLKLIKYDASVKKRIEEVENKENMEVTIHLNKQEIEYLEGAIGFPINNKRDAITSLHTLIEVGI